MSRSNTKCMPSVEGHKSDCKTIFVSNQVKIQLLEIDPESSNKPLLYRPANRGPTPCICYSLLCGDGQHIQESWAESLLGLPVSPTRCL